MPAHPLDHMLQQDYEGLGQMNRDYFDMGFTWLEQRWAGRQMLKYATDQTLFMRLMMESQPTLIIETGTHAGGSALWFRDISRMFGVQVEVISIDVAKVQDHKDEDITYLRGHSTSPNVIHKVRKQAQRHERVMVTLDSDHRKQVVLEELKVYADAVTKDCYLVVEDTFLGAFDHKGKDNAYDCETGWHAYKEWYTGDSDFYVDRTLGTPVTQNPLGYLRRWR